MTVLGTLFFIKKLDDAKFDLILWFQQMSICCIWNPESHIQFS